LAARTAEEVGVDEEQLEAIRQRDRNASVVWFSEPLASSLSWAFTDRRALLQEVERLRAPITVRCDVEGPRRPKPYNYDADDGFVLMLKEETQEALEQTAGDGEV
jgi:hypothetical protein